MSGNTAFPGFAQPSGLSQFDLTTGRDVSISDGLQVYDGTACWTRSVSNAAGTVERELTITKRCLLFPLKYTEEKGGKHVSVLVDGASVRDFYMQIFASMV